jgi:hypothetical protein
MAATAMSDSHIELGKAIQEALPALPFVIHSILTKRYDLLSTIQIVSGLEVAILVCLIITPQ